MKLKLPSINEFLFLFSHRYAEFPDCQEVISKSSETVSKLMLMVGSHLQERNDSDLLMYISTYNKYAAQIAANTLFCCACSLHTPRILVESGIHKRMINLLKLISDHDLALR